MSTWLQIDAQSALRVLQSELSECANANQVMVRLCSSLSGRYEERLPISPDPNYLSPAAMRTFTPLVYRYVRPADDIERAGTGVYSPEDRDHAQRFRDSLLSKLMQSEQPEATNVLRELMDDPALADRRDWILHLLDERVKIQANLPPWTPTDLRSFAREHEIDPKTDHDLFKIARKRLQEIKNDVEKSDNSLRDELRVGDEERKLRKWLTRKLNDRSRKRYTLPQEEEIDQEEKPDIRIENPNTNPVSVEVKWADRWTLKQLLERLENQLVGQYLRSHNTRFGVYALGMIGYKDRKHWKDPNTGGLLTFQQVLEIIERRAKALVTERSDVEDIAVIGIDFRPPE